MNIRPQVPLITFCIPFFKGLGYLKESIQSVVDQSQQAWLCVVVDDCGPEPEARMLVASFSDPRISYRRNESNLGLAGNWNKCISLANTPFVTILHADDRLLPNYLMYMSEMFRMFPASNAIFCRATIIDKNGLSSFSFADRFKNILMPSLSQPIILKGELGLTALMRGNFVFCPSLCYRKDKLTEAPFNLNWRMVIDLDWLVASLLNGAQLVGNPAVAYEYRRHSTNQTSILTRSKIRFHEEIAIHHSVALKCSSKGWLTAARAARIMLSVRLHLFYQMVQSFVKLQLKDSLDLLLILLQSRNR